MKIVDHNLKNQAFTRNESADFSKIFSDLSCWALGQIGYYADGEQKHCRRYGDDHFTLNTNVTRAQFCNFTF
jgi:hypothetical protein